MTVTGDGPVPDAPGTGVAASEARAADLRNLARGSSLNLAGSFVSALLSLALPVIITRGLGREEAGTFFAATALFTILVNVGSLGADTGLLRTIPRLRALGRTRDLPRLLGVSFLPPAMFGTVIGILLLGLSPWAAELIVGRADSQAGTFTQFCYVLAPALPIAVLYIVALAASRGFGPVKPLVLVEKIGRSTVQTAAVWVVQLLAPSAMLLIIAWTAPYVAAAVVIGLWLRRLLSKALRQRAASAAPPRSLVELGREFWAFSAPRAVSRIFSVALQRFDILLVSAIRGPADAAIYTAASRFLIVGLMFVQAIQQVMAPKISELLAREDTPRALQMYRTTTAWLTALSWPMYLLFAVFAPLLLDVFGPGYRQGAPVVVILCLTMLVATACGPVDTVLLMGGRSSLSLLNTGVALAVNVGLDLLLVPRYGITGAALGWMVAILLNNLLPLVQVRVFLRMHPFGVASRRVAVMALACFGALPLVVRGLAGPTLIALIVAGALGTAAYAALLAWQREALELHALRAVLQRGSAKTDASDVTTRVDPVAGPSGGKRRARSPLHRGWRRATRLVRRR